MNKYAKAMMLSREKEHKDTDHKYANDPYRDHKREWAKEDMQTWLKRGFTMKIPSRKKRARIMSVW